ncbi:MAG: hypothetical protein ABIQ74_07465 [Chitinophagales bacterium]
MKKREKNIILSSFSFKAFCSAAVGSVQAVAAAAVGSANAVVVFAWLWRMEDQLQKDKSKD